MKYLKILGCLMAVVVVLGASNAHATPTPTPTPTPTATATPTPTATPTSTPSCSITNLPVGNNGLSAQYTCCPTQVTSATVPVTILPSAILTTWNFKLASTGPNAAATGIYVFPYKGALVTTVGQTPANIYPIDPGGTLSDAQVCGSPGCANALGESFGAILYTGSTAVTEFTCWR
jgi:hypothetical protein